MGSLGQIAGRPKTVLSQPDRGQNDRKYGYPDHARAVAVVRIGQRAAHEGIAQERERDGGGEFAERGGNRRCARRAT